MTMTAAYPGRRGRRTSPPGQSQPVLWWQLINDMEAYTARTGCGLAGTWALVHRGDYTAARARFDNLQATINQED